MIRISIELRDKLLQHLDSFGYCSEFGAVIGDKEFVIWEEELDIFLVHKSEIESQGFLVKLKK